MAQIDNMLRDCAASLRRGDRVKSVASYIESDMYRRTDLDRLPKLRAIVRALRETEDAHAAATRLEEMAEPDKASGTDAAAAEKFHREMMGKEPAPAKAEKRA